MFYYTPLNSLHINITLYAVNKQIIWSIYLKLNWLCFYVRHV